MNTRVLGDRVLIKADEVDNKTKSGLLLTGIAIREEIVTGTVVSVGPGKKDTIIHPDLKVGCKVVFIKYSASELPVDGEPHLVVRMDDLIAIIDD